MRRFLIVALAAIACGGSTEPAGSVDVEINTAARPTTSFTVRNRTGATVQLKACVGQVGTAAIYTGKPVVSVIICQQAMTVYALDAGASLAGTVAIGAAGKYQLSVTLGDGTGRVSSPFDVP